MNTATKQAPTAALLDNDSTTATATATATVVSNTVSIALQTPVVRGQQSITEIIVRRPRTADLRGISLAELLTLRTEAVTTLLPRISTPTLLRHEIDDLDPADFVSIATEVVSFLVPRSVTDNSL